jgi:hypothetical protein
MCTKNYYVSSIHSIILSMYMCTKNYYVSSIHSIILSMYMCTLVEIIFCFVLPERDILPFPAKGSTGFNSKFYLEIRVDGRYIVIFSTHVHTQYDTVDGRYIVIFSTHVHTQYDTLKCHTNCNYNTSSNELLKFWEYLCSS